MDSRRLASDPLVAPSEGPATASLDNVFGGADARCSLLPDAGCGRSAIEKLSNSSRSSISPTAYLRLTVAMSGWPRKNFENSSAIAMHFPLAALLESFANEMR